MFSFFFCFCLCLIFNLHLVMFVCWLHYFWSLFLLCVCLHFGGLVILFHLMSCFFMIFFVSLWLFSYFCYTSEKQAIHSYIYTNISYMYIQVHTYTYIYISVYMFKDTCISLYIYIYVSNQWGGKTNSYPRRHKAFLWVVKWFGWVCLVLTLLFIF